MEKEFTAAFPRKEETKDAPIGYRLISGRQVIDEGLIKGRLVSRYRNCTGQVWPDMHLGKQKLEDTVTAADNRCFSVVIGGNEVEFVYEGFKKTDDDFGLFGKCESYSLSLLSLDKTLRVEVLTRLDGGDIITRKLKIHNLSEKAVALDSVCPFSGVVFDHITEFWYDKAEVIKDDGFPYSAAYCRDTRWGHEGDFYYEEVKDRIKFGSNHGKSGWNRPNFWLKNNFSGETFITELGYSGNWDAEIQYVSYPYGVLDEHAHPFGEYNQTRHLLTAKIGLFAPKGEAVRVLEPGAVLDTPFAAFGTFRDSDDAVTQALHTYIRNSILPPLPKDYPVCEIEGNHRGYLCDREYHDGIIADIDAIAATGCEMYVFDAGWYGGKDAKQSCWPAFTGDWTPASWLEKGLKPISDHVHKKGMRFGLWAEIEAAGWESRLIKEHPDWQITRHGKVCAGALDLSKEEVRKWALSEILRMCDEYGVDMWRIDHNKNIGLGGTREYLGYTENTLWRYYDAFNRLFRDVRKARPDLVLQNCAGGGGRLDLGVLNLFHNTELSDWHRSPRGLRIQSNMTMLLPPEILLRGFSTESGDLMMDVDLDAQIRAAMLARPTYRGAAPTLSEFTPYLREFYDFYAGFYKEFMRPLFKDCKVYHHTPFLKVNEPCPFVVLEYADTDKEKAVAGIFTLSDTGEGFEYLLKMQGLDKSKNYNVTFLNSGEKLVLSGFKLTRGIKIDIGRQMSSEMLTFEAVK